MNTVDLIFAGYVGGIASIVALYPAAAWAETRVRGWLARTAHADEKPRPEPQWPRIHLPRRDARGRFVSPKTAMHALLERDVQAVRK